MAVVLVKKREGSTTAVEALETAGVMVILPKITVGFTVAVAADTGVGVKVIEL